jgi:hypothetical protein
MTKDEALDMALEFVEANHSGGPDAFELIAAIKQARSAPVQEPVAWTVSGKITDWSKDFSAYQTKHYTRPVYTPPAAQRQWVGLTDEEIQAIAFTAVSENWDWLRFARAIEAKLRSKNTP